jgi:hypothetical protein
MMKRQVSLSEATEPLEREIRRLCALAPSLSASDQITYLRRIRELVSAWYKAQIEWLNA